MTTINLGKIKPLYKGTYTGGVTYRPLDFTLYSGNLYVCKASSTGNLPTDPAYFDPVVNVNAASLPNTPSGSIAATTVQAAINELDAEKVAKTAVIAIANGGTGATSANAAADAIGAFRRGTLLGTVSQSSGVPTGAVIERGSNANGEYVRWADGTQICSARYTGTGQITQALGSLFTSPSNESWTFPAAFAGAYPAESGKCSAIIPYGWLALGSTASQSLTAMSYRVIAVSSSALAPQVSLVAIGRWL